ncbi:class I glutamine amidotransferase-like protein [Coniochaeta ligniaria NRRL 30616]|uniref:Class I glutamine amidotransferase-like protein n=1 Tax=Coniochaeta ligniaria NRRL 30616 TaxID=1408157 RepID=A0A1J7JD29_9PEZI|nr:class I glutamine amidotransferase-like protein [Coniochaeta ligniaria NRRL 30616]
MSTRTPKPFRIAVMLDEAQIADIVGVDIFGNLSTEYLDWVLSLAEGLEAFREHTLDIEFFWLATTLEPTRVTPGLRYLPNMTYDDCPRDLDLVLTGGTLLTYRPEAAAKFIREAWPKTRVWLTTCFGSIWLADAGVMAGVRATTNRKILPTARKVAPQVQWLEQRWVVEDKPYDGEGKGELWTAGGAGAGIDMIAQFCLTKWDNTFVRTMALDGLEFTPEGSHGQFYSTP